MNLILFFISVIFIFGYISFSFQIMSLTLLCLFVFCIVYCFKNLNEHITLLSFLIAFFTFLMGRMILPLFSDTSDLILENGGQEFSKKILSNVYLCLYIAIISVYVGYKSTYKHYHRSNLTVSSFDENEYGIVVLRKTTKKILYFSFIFEFVLTLERINFVLANGYMAMYMDFNSNLPYIFTLIAFLFGYSFCFFLATIPSKKEAKIPILLYVFIAILSLGTGQRGGFVLGILFIIMYFFMRNTLKPGDKLWIGKKAIITIAVCLPLLIMLLLAMAYYRLEKDMTTSTSLLVTFLYQQSFSSEVIGYTMEFENKFPPGRLYLFGDIVDYFRHNIFSQLLFDMKPIEPQSVRHALEDHSLDATLTYMSNPNFYFNGGGYGGCYIAEAWKDLSYWGVFVVSYVYGIVLCKIPLWCRRNVWIGSIALLMFRPIIFAPRSHAMTFIALFTSTMVIVLYVCLYIIYKNAKLKPRWQKLN